MSNLEYLEKVKEARTLKVSSRELYEMFEGREGKDEEIEYRKAKALEIIAEEICEFNRHFVDFENSIINGR